MYYKLDSLRGIAALMVILYHSPFKYSDFELSFISNAYLFVDFFFILSGFVMSFAYGNKIVYGYCFRNYITLRLGRIYPIHLFMLLAWVPYILIKQYLYTSGYGGNDQFYASNLYSFTSNIFLLQSMGLHTCLSWNYVSWSISVEFFTYILFFITLISVDKKETLVVPLFISGLAYFFIYTLNLSTFDITTDYGFIRCIGAFYLGVFLLRLHKRLNYESTKNTIYILEFTSISLLIISLVYADKGFFFAMLSIMSFALVIFTFSITNNNGFIGRFLQINFIRNIGTWSYSIYMTHALIVSLTSKMFEFVLKCDLDQGMGSLSLVLNTLMILLTIFISKYTYIFIEDRFRNKTRKYLSSCPKFSLSTLKLST